MEELCQFDVFYTSRSGVMVKARYESGHSYEQSGRGC